ncbi:S1 family peptidase [Pontixanthobacter sp.]|uniref:S1 family peptidase n=1 Tax=Pontixanthobacter sp. TaxID=2792078 RepID=UPI003C7A7BC8
MRSKISLALMCAVSLPILSYQAIAQDDVEEPVAFDEPGHDVAQPEPLDLAETLAAEAKSYSGIYGVSHEEAMRRLTIMHGTGEEIRALETEIGSELAGTFFDNSADFGLVVRTTAAERRAERRLVRRAERRENRQEARRDARREERRAERRDERRSARRAARLAARGITEADIELAETILSTQQAAPIRFRERAKKTRRNARQTIKQKRNEIAMLIGHDIPLGYGYNEQTGAFRVMVTASGTEASRISALQPQLVALLGDEVELEVTPIETTEDHTRGGGGLYTSDADTTANCTTGFVAYEGTNRAKLGVLTAGHCGNSYTYKAPDSPTRGYVLSVPTGREAFNADMDLQWMSAPSGHAAVGEFYADHSSTVRRVTGYCSVANTTQANDWINRKGTFICHYGKTTGQSCGEVIYTDAAPAYANDPANDKYGCSNGPTYVACNDSFVEVRNKVVAGETQLACFGGDSGGPWFAYGTAFGIHSGGRKTSSNPGQCQAAYYTPIEKASSINVAVYIP